MRPRPVFSRCLIGRCGEVLVDEHPLGDCLRFSEDLCDTRRAVCGLSIPIEASKLAGDCSRRGRGNDELVIEQPLGVTRLRVPSIVYEPNRRILALGRGVLDACRRTRPAVFDGTVGGTKLSRQLWIHKRKLGARERGFEQKIHHDSRLAGEAGRERLEEAKRVVQPRDCARGLGRRRSALLSTRPCRDRES